MTLGSFTRRWGEEFVRWCIPWVVLLVGLNRGEALLGCGCNGISRRGQSAGYNAACPPTRRGGYTATKGYTSACPSAVGDLVAGATQSSTSKGPARKYCCRRGITVESGLKKIFNVATLLFHGDPNEEANIQFGKRKIILSVNAF